MRSENLERILLMSVNSSAPDKPAEQERTGFRPSRRVVIRERNSRTMTVAIQISRWSLPTKTRSTTCVLYYLVPMVLALAGGVWTYAEGRHFPLASQVQGTFLSFKILPTVLGTLVKPFGHPFKITPKGGSSQTSTYAREIFWTAASLIALTVFGLIINTIPEWRIVETEHMLPVVAFWSAINVVVLFLVCMMSLQAPRRRGEERFELDEPIWISSLSGVISSARTHQSRAWRRGAHAIPNWTARTLLFRRTLQLVPGLS
jgi:hypothetical protein